MCGAGASYGSVDVIPHVPPLGPKLFAALVKAGGIAATVSPALRTLFEEDFELGMVAFREQRDRDTPRLLRDMATYLVDFEPGPKNLYHTLIDMVRSSSRRTTIATTNYEMLIETAAVAAGCGFTYRYPHVTPEAIALLKVHGSCNFLPDTGFITLRNVTMEHCGSNLDTQVRIAGSAQEIRDFCRTEDSLAPAIAVYAPGKAVPYSPTFVGKQQEMWGAAVKDASVVYVIGLKVNNADEHIWAPLARTKARVEYVGLKCDSDRFGEWSAEFRGKRPSHVLEHDFAHALPLIGIQMRQ